VRDAQKAAEAVCKPGATLRELHNAAGKVFADSGHTKWAFSHSKDRTVAHGLGHFVGLYVHDSGSYDTRFEPGMVITIEPGWYDKDQGWGIRIEDMYLITADGFEHLSKDAPREIEEIEKAMGGD
jgi:Xaa-Pro aminopeptidase